VLNILGRLNEHVASTYGARLVPRMVRDTFAIAIAAIAV